MSSLITRMRLALLVCLAGALAAGCLALAGCSSTKAKVESDKYVLEATGGWAESNIQTTDDGFDIMIPDTENALVSVSVVSAKEFAENQTEGDPGCWIATTKELDNGDVAVFYVTDYTYLSWWDANGDADGDSGLTDEQKDSAIKLLTGDKYSLKDVTAMESDAVVVETCSGIIADQVKDLAEGFSAK